MATDANLVLQASVTATATHNGAWVSLLGGTPTRGLFAHVLYSAASDASGSETVTFQIDISPDGGTTVYAGEFVAVDQALTLTTTAQAGELVIPFNLNTKGVLSGSTPAVRLTATFAGSGTSPTITYSGNIELGHN